MCVLNDVYGYTFYLLAFLLNLLRYFLFVLSGSGLCAIKILCWRWEVADSTTSPFLERAPSYSQEMASGLFTTFQQKWLFCFVFFASFCCLTLYAYLLCKISFWTKINANWFELNTQDLTIKQSSSTGPKFKVTVTSNFLMSPNSN